MAEGPRHGMQNTSTYHSWSAMRGRCFNPNHHKYHLYGGRGIRVDPRWRYFSNFLADMGVRPNGTTIDRFPNKNGHYEPGNCRWANIYQQNRNRNNVRLISYRGKQWTVAELSKKFSVPHGVLWNRIFLLKWKIDRAINVSSLTGR